MWSASFKRTALFILLTGLLGTVTIPLPGTEETPETVTADEQPDPLEVALVLPLAVKPNPEGLLTDRELDVLTGESGPLEHIVRLAEQHRLSLAVDPYVLHSLAESRSPQSEETLRVIVDSPVHKYLQSYAGVSLPLLAGQKYFQEFAFGSVNDLALQQPETFENISHVFEPVISSPNATFDEHGLAQLEKIIAETRATVLLSDQQRAQDPPPASVKHYRAKMLLPESTILFNSSSASESANLFLQHGNTDQFSQMLRDLQQQIPQHTNQAIVAPQFALDPGMLQAEIIDTTVQTRFDELLRLLNLSTTTTLISLKDVVADEASGKLLEEIVTPQNVNKDDGVSAIIQKQAKVSSFLSALTNPTPATAQYRLFMGQTLGMYIVPRDREAAVTAYQTATDNILESITLEQGSDITMITEKSEVWVTVNNNLVSEATMVVRIISNNNRLVLPASLPVTVDGQSKQMVTIPVTALSNGNVTLTLSLYSESGTKIGPTQQLNITIQAELELIVALVFVVLVAGFLSAGIVRSVLKRKKAKRLIHDD